MSTYCYAQLVSIHHGVKCTFLCIESGVGSCQVFQFHEFTGPISLHADVHALLISLQSLCVAFVIMSIQRCFSGLLFEYVWKQVGMVVNCGYMSCHNFSCALVVLLISLGLSPCC